MGFSNKQVSALRGEVDPAFARFRKLKDGRELPYIEGWYAISEANRIFGFDAWSRETVEVKCVQAREVRGGSFQVIYLAKVRVTVRAGADLAVREGYGTGDASGDSLGESHERALKSAETDATKRALATFGRPFGLALHVPANQAENAPATERRAIPDSARFRTRQRKGLDGRYRLVRPTRIGLIPTAVVQPLPSLNPSEPAAGEGPIEGAHEAPAAPSLPEANGAGVVSIVRPARRRSPHHLRYVMGQACLICGRNPSDPHHLRFAQPRAMGRKVSDEYTVPLCRTHHRQLHHSGDEVGWWIAMEVDPLPIAQDLWNESQGQQDVIATTSIGS